MSNPGGRALSVRRYFVDEAGDSALFARSGRVIVGSTGCSRFFILGLLDIPDPEALGADLEDLRARLRADPYFRGVPSMQPEARKTALAFHATEDPPEVRREVFSVLLRHEMRFFAVVRDKAAVLEYVRERNERDPTYRYNQNELYDSLVRRLFRDRLHKDDHCRICFAKRGKSDRSAALLNALEEADRRFRTKWGFKREASIGVMPGTPEKSHGLQAVDYLLWGLQRLYERREERYVVLLWPLFRLVHDLDDTRGARYGVHYTQRNPLNLAALKGNPRI